ncbi:DUF1266 domain-containing protein [Actinomyces howellii]|uniref:DUF1266 domain-containing protein n=1 Tax=Actinomyces howellii TaxID=52771 RepID=A0A3S4R1N8_9ACTO|nr:DUF1266 domain-containing protein [Actinomyces howellii]VEG25767.1 Uncharacterised protein [Actinomyces howellii]
MLTELNLLSAPIRFDDTLLNKPYEDLLRELSDTEISGWGRLNRMAAARGLKGAFGITDAASTIARCEELAEADGAWADPMVAAETVPALAMLAGAAGARGFDDCRIVRILTLARTARHIDESQLADLLGRHARRIAQRYAGWGQYLASVLVGKAVFQATFAVAGNDYIIDPRQFVDAVHVLALSAPVTLFRAPLWPGEDLRPLLGAVEPFVDADAVRAHRLAASGWLATAEHPLDAATSKLLTNKEASAGTFLRARDLAQEVFWHPVDMAGLGVVFDDLRRSRMPLWDLPARADGSAAKAFWAGVHLDHSHWSGVPFLRISDAGRLTAVLTEESCVVVTGSGLKRTWTPVPWDEARIHALVVPGERISFYLGETGLGDLFPNWSAPATADPGLSDRLNAFLAGMGPRLRSFTANNPL